MVETSGSDSRTVLPDTSVNSASPAGETAASVCVRCKATGLFEPCCSSHDAVMCHLCYRQTHFVEVCGCPTCLADGLPRILAERTQATTPAYIASAHHVHEATVRNGLWTARCDWSAGWAVPLIHDPEAAVVFVSCPKCREMREAS